MSLPPTATIQPGATQPACLPHRGWFVWVLLFLLCSAAGLIQAAAPAARWYSIRPFQGGSWTPDPGSKDRIWTSPILKTPEPWQEMILSWKALETNTTSSSCSYRFELRPVMWKKAGPEPFFFHLGRWSPGPGPYLQPSQSDPPSTNAWGKILTDLIQLHEAADAFQVRVTLVGDVKAAEERLIELMISTTSGSGSSADATSLGSQAWGRPVLEVPPLSQHAFAGGKSWCSPTCLAMMLGYWSKKLPLRHASAGVPDIASQVHDAEWGGTGNWSFNVAYLNREPSLRAVALRLNGLPDLERSILSNCPVVISVSLNLMRGLPRTRVRDGHLVVVCGFDDKGDVWVNDPDSTHPPVPSKPIRRKYRREDVLKAWDYSRRTAYLVWPANSSPPVAPSLLESVTTPP